jgi:crotonobetainyl-CoA:carnitine CoA-transferase CaiB-like acyl-CoA transferase
MNRQIPLMGTKILDLTQLLPGPFCSKLLASYGAEVVKVERPGVGDLARAFSPKKGTNAVSFLYLNQNKKSLTLDLKSDEGRNIFLNLAKNFDVILESSRPGVMEKMGVGYKQLSKVNPKIIFCSISAYGQTGPFTEKAAHDLNILGLSAILEMTGEYGSSPVIPGVQIADISSGLYACIAIMLALLERDRRGVGQKIDISMLDCTISFLSIHAADFFASGKLPQRGNGLLTGGFACYNIYKTKDGRYMTLVGLEPHLWKEACLALDFESWIEKQFDPKFQEAMKEELGKLFSQRSMEEWIDFFEGKNVCCEPILNIQETFFHPQVVHRKIKTKVRYPGIGSVEGIGVPIKFSNIKIRKQSPAPALGKHTIQILKALGYRANDIQSLIKKKIL